MTAKTPCPPAADPEVASSPHSPHPTSPVKTTLTLMPSRQLEISGRWKQLLERLQGQKKQMADLQAVLSLLQGVESTSNQLKELQVGPAPADPEATQQGTPPWHSRGTLGPQRSPVHPWPGAGQLHSLWAAAGRNSGAAAEA